MIILLNILLNFALTGNSMNELDSFIKESLKDYDKVEYIIVSPTNLDNESFTIDNIREFKLSGKYAYVPIKIKNGNSINNALVTIKVKLYKKVWVAKRLIKKHETLSKSDFEIVEKEVSKLKDVLALDSGQLSNFRAKRNIRENSIVTNKLIEKIPVVKKGDRVKALFTNDAIKIEFDAIARTEGIKGDKIRVKRYDNKLFVAEILDNDKVKIIE